MALSKMAPPKVVEEILLEIIKEFNGGIDQYKENSGALLSFMLSGREPFHAALQYFSKADRINFRDFGLDICVKKATHCFGYDWKLMNILLQVCLPSINHLCVYECPQNYRGYSILDKVLKNDLKHLTLFADLPNHYKYLLRYNYKFDTVHSQHLFHDNPTLSEILLIPAQEHKIIVSNFGSFINETAPGVLYLGVKKLIFEKSGFCPPDLCRKSLHKFSSLLFECFPNLEHFVAECIVYSSWFPVINTLLNTHFQWMNEVQEIPTKIKGDILFRVFDAYECINRFRRFDGFFVGVMLDYDKSKMYKSWKLHDGLNVKWEIEFGLTFHTAREDFSDIDGDEIQSIPSVSDTQSNASSTQSIYFYDDDLSEASTLSDIDDDVFDSDSDDEYVDVDDNFDGNDD